MRTDDYITNYQIRGNSVIIYEEFQGSRRRHTNRINFTDEMLKVREKAYSGVFSKGAKKRMKKAVCLLNQITPIRNIYNPVINRTQNIKLNFLTVTISDNTQNYTSKKAYADLLRPLLQWLTKTKGVKLYVWKAELQARGQIHYHIITPTYIHYQELRDKWNYLQLKKGYLEGYEKKYKSINPNSTDVHSTRRIKDVEAYLLKYMLKDPIPKEGEGDKSKLEKIEMDGKVWDCSEILKSEKYYTFEKNQDFDAAIKWKIDKGQALKVEIDYATIIYFKKGKPTEIIPMEQRFAFEKWRKDLWERAQEAVFKDVA